MTDFADQMRTTEDDEWADLDAPDLSRHYTEPQIRRWDRYQGQLSDVPEGEARALLAELMNYFEVDGFAGTPLPPDGLPGHQNKATSVDDPTYQAIRAGWCYFVAAARGQSRAMHNRWDEAAALLRRAAEDEFNRIIERDVERAIEASRERAAKPQYIYFIGGTGPIKIGITENVDGRLKGLQTSHHERLEVLAWREGCLDDEREYHRRYAQHRLNGEWFERCPAILAEIDRLSSQP